MPYLFLRLLLENPPLTNLNINIGLLKCCLVMYLSFILLTVFVCACVLRCIPWCACGLQRTTHGSRFSLGMWVGRQSSGHQV